MKITIIGAGAVGFNLASTLAAEGHDVSVVERRPNHLARLQDRLDVSVVEGSGTSAATLREAGVETADLFIAVTDIDEVNMVACALAHRLGKGRRIARVRNQDFASRDAIVPKHEFGISRIINPDEVTISALVETILSPGVTDVAEFGDGGILLRGTVLEERSPFIGVPLQELRQRFEHLPFLIAAIARDEEIVIPAGDTLLKPRDHVFLIMTREALPALRQLVLGAGEKVKRVVIFGCGRVGVGLASRIEDRIDHVVIIDSDEASTQRAARDLSKTLVLRGPITDPGIIAEANLRRADYFVATSPRDELNLVAAALAGKGEAGPRVGVVTADPDFVPALSSLDLDLVINERLITVDTILRFVRPGRYLSIKRLNEQGAEIVELSAQKGSRSEGKRLQDLGLPAGALVVAVHRDGQPILPHGGTQILGGDTVVMVALPQVREKAARMFFSKKWLAKKKPHR